MFVPPIKLCFSQLLFSKVKFFHFFINLQFVTKLTKFILNGRLQCVSKNDIKNNYKICSAIYFQVPIEETNSVMKCSTRPFNNASTFLINIVSHIGVIISVIVLILTIYGEYILV